MRTITSAGQTAFPFLLGWCLTTAKEALRTLLPRCGSDRVGSGSNAGGEILVSPLTQDRQPLANPKPSVGGHPTQVPSSRRTKQPSSSSPRSMEESVPNDPLEWGPVTLHSVFEERDGLFTRMHTSQGEGSPVIVRVGSGCL